MYPNQAWMIGARLKIGPLSLAPLLALALAIGAGRALALQYARPFGSRLFQLLFARTQGFEHPCLVDRYGRLRGNAGTHDTGPEHGHRANRSSI